ncbi:MAG: 3-oxoacyl-ACP reductase family protein [Pseudomonadota bacterium]
MSGQQLLSRQTIIVTGAAAGIGQAFSLALAAHGANVVVADIGPADETMRMLAEAEAPALYVQTDVGDGASVENLAAKTLERFGRIDGLINNAAYFREVKLTDFDKIDPEQWDRIFTVNVKGLWQCCKAVMPAMREQGSGAIVNIASVVAIAGQPGYLQYVATKGAVLSMTKGLAKEVGRHGVRVNCIAPGFVLTDATRDRPVEWQQSFLKARALSREQRPDDLVGTAVYLLSDLANFVSGQTIVVDGGHIMY